MGPRRSGSHPGGLMTSERQAKGESRVPSLPQEGSSDFTSVNIALSDGEDVYTGHKNDDGHVTNDFEPGGLYGQECLPNSLMQRGDSYDSWSEDVEQGSTHDFSFHHGERSSTTDEDRKHSMSRWLATVDDNLTGLLLHSPAASVHTKHLEPSLCSFDLYSPYDSYVDIEHHADGPSTRKEALVKVASPVQKTSAMPMQAHEQVKNDCVASQSPPSDETSILSLSELSISQGHDDVMEEFRYELRHTIRSLLDQHHPRVCHQSGSSATDSQPAESGDGRDSLHRGTLNPGCSKRKAEDELADDTRENGKAKVASLKRDGTNAQPRRLACPYYQHNVSSCEAPDRRSCRASSFANYTRVKEHLGRRHPRRDYCPRCNDQFDNPQALQSHLEAPSQLICGSKPRYPADYGMSKTQWAEIRNKMPPIPEEEKWFRAFGILFPHVSREDYPSPCKLFGCLHTCFQLCVPLDPEPLPLGDTIADRAPLGVDFEPGGRIDALLEFITAQAAPRLRTRLESAVPHFSQRATILHEMEQQLPRILRELTSEFHQESQGLAGPSRSETESNTSTRPQSNIHSDGHSSDPPPLIGQHESEAIDLSTYSQEEGDLGNLDQIWNDFCHTMDDETYEN